jgi:histidinol phosphatase-like enzyme (inositol monophosphatase family)
MTSSNAPQLDGRFGFAVEIARRAGELTLALFRASEFGLEHKADGSPVTRADRDAETLLRQLIGERFPDDGILGEEFGESPGKSGYKWVLDPIDGTKSFVAGVPLYTTLVAVLRDDQPEIGVIFAPAAGEIVFAERGKGCWHAIGDHPPRRAHVSTIAELGDAVFVTTSARAFSTGRARDCRHVYETLENACRVTRTWGDAFGYLLVATGRAEVMIDPVMNLWDAAALEPVIAEAGGSFTDWRGQPTVHSGESAATNEALADQVLRILAENG